MKKTALACLLLLSTIGCSSHQPAPESPQSSRDLVESYTYYQDCSDRCQPEEGFHVLESYTYHGDPAEFPATRAKGLTAYRFDSRGDERLSARVDLQTPFFDKP